MSRITAILAAFNTVHLCGPGPSFWACKMCRSGQQGCQAVKRTMVGHGRARVLLLRLLRQQVLGAGALGRQQEVGRQLQRLHGLQGRAPPHLLPLLLRPRQHALCGAIWKEHSWSDLRGQLPQRSEQENRRSQSDEER